MNVSPMRAAIDAAYRQGGKASGEREMVRQLADALKPRTLDPQKMAAMVEAAAKEIDAAAADPTQPAGRLGPIGSAPATDELFNAMALPHDLAGMRVVDTRRPEWAGIWSRWRVLIQPEAASRVMALTATGSRFIVIGEMVAGPHGGGCGVLPARNAEECAFAVVTLYSAMREQFGARQMLLDFVADDSVADAVTAVQRKLMPRTVETTMDALTAAARGAA